MLLLVPRVRPRIIGTYTAPFNNGRVHAVGGHPARMAESVSRLIHRHVCISSEADMLNRGKGPTPVIFALRKARPDYELTSRQAGHLTLIHPVDRPDR
jgi:hypothetical protein